MFLQKLAVKGAAYSDWEVCGESSSLCVNVGVTFIS